jgi:hypothetical protein
VNAGWTTVEQVRAAVRRRWDDQTLLRAYAQGEPCPPVVVALRGPTAGRIGDDLAAVRDWVSAIDRGGRDGRCYEVEHAEVGGRVIGRNRLPVRVRVTAYAQAWALLGVGAEVAAYDEVLALVADEPALRAWAGRHPLRAVELAGEWPVVVAAYRWLVAARGSGAYVRQVSAPGVDTKAIERHRGVLAQVLGVSSSATGFVEALGLSGRPETVRLRADPSVGVLGGFSEAVLRRDELAVAPVSVSCAVVVENEVTYLSLPVPVGGVLLWGRGFDVGRPGSLPWLAGTAVHYWGDLDTHGFAILDRLRAWLPEACSFLMDRSTLLEHRDRWGAEPSPTRARLARLTVDEDELYRDLVADRYGPRVRLEQERLDWAWVGERLPYGR